MLAVYTPFDNLFSFFLMVEDKEVEGTVRWSKRIEKY